MAGELCDAVSGCEAGDSAADDGENAEHPVADRSREPTRQAHADADQRGNHQRPGDELAGGPRTR